MKRTLLAITIAAWAIAAAAFPVTANLVSQHVGTSVGGQQIRVCVYSYNGHNYEQAIQISASCAYSIQLQ